MLVEDELKKIVYRDGSKSYKREKLAGVEQFSEWKNPAQIAVHLFFASGRIKRGGGVTERGYLNLLASALSLRAAGPATVLSHKLGKWNTSRDVILAG